MSSLYLRRRITNWIAMGLSMLATLVGLAFLAWILWETLRQGIAALNPSLFTKITAYGADGGLANAMVGSLVINFIGIAIATPIGVLAGAWLAEYANRTTLGESIRFLNDILLSAPSIVIGLFVYTIVVLPTTALTHGSTTFSGFAGGIALALIALPVIVRTTDEMLRLVPRDLREASLALGVTKARTILVIVLPTASSGIITGVMLAFARAMGETAPLLLTALGNDLFIELNPTKRMSTLSLQIFGNAITGFKAAQARAWAGALTVVALVLLFTVAARLIARRSSVSRGR